MELNSNESPKENGALKSDSEFAQVVQESREKIQAQQMTEPKVKRGRGRPRKVSVDQSASPQPQSPPTPQAEPLDVSEYLVPPLVALSKIPAAKAGIPELALTADEAIACAQSLNKVLSAFIPDVGQMSPKTAAIVSSCLTIGSIGFQKYSIYKATIEARQRELMAKEPEPKIDDSVPTIRNGQRDASEYFPTKRV